MKLMMVKWRWIWLTKNKYDLIISDINMPNLNGIQLTQSIRKLAGYKYTPILLLTTESAKDIKTEGKQAGSTGWIIKPFNPESIVNTVRKVIK